MYFWLERDGEWGSLSMGRRVQTAESHIGTESAAHCMRNEPISILVTPRLVANAIDWFPKINK